jgi:hypothetical protein
MDPFSFTSVPIFMYGEDNNSQLSHGTAFFYKKNDVYYLVTNWHNLSGRNSNTGQPLHKYGATPQHIGQYIHLECPPYFSNDLLVFKLYDINGKAFWKQHPIHGQNVDIAVLEVYPPNGYKFYPINSMQMTTDMAIGVGMDVFVLGFPVKLFTHIHPIWKRATIATEYAILVDGLPKFLIDTATAKGMSGAPVIARSQNSYTCTNGNTNFGTGPYTQFLGIYSGRSKGDELDTVQLGVVWRKELIDEIIDNGVPGDYKIKQSSETV